MADFGIAFHYLMQNEDSRLSGNVTPDPSASDPEAIARFGINSAAHPEAVASGFYTMPIADALEWAQKLYKIRYFAGIGGYSIACQDIANKFFDLAVNEGLNQATKIVQRACNSVLTPNGTAVGYLPLTIDGIAGEKTSEAINACAPEQLLPAIKSYAVQFYKDVALRQNWDPRKLEALLARAQR